MHVQEVVFPIIVLERVKLTGLVYLLVLVIVKLGQIPVEPLLPCQLVQQIVKLFGGVYQKP